MKQRYTLGFLFLLLSLVGCTLNQDDPIVNWVAMRETPLIATSLPDDSSSQTASGILLGIYPSGFIQHTVDEIIQLDAWTASVEKKTAIAATFLDFQDPDVMTSLPTELDAAWDNGYIPFINLAAGYYHLFTAQDIAHGDLDPDIRRWARAFADWSLGGEKRAFIAPLQEMNGVWTAYGGDPENFKLAYHRILYIFQEEGVALNAVSWVFAPNGWSSKGHEFELYYPGDDVVDVIGFSSFNFGDCSNWPKWEVYVDIYEPYLNRLSEMAPDKPIFIAEIGTVADGGNKNIWLKNTYQQLVGYPNLHGILYFNRAERAGSRQHCPWGTDYRVYDVESEEGYWGYLEGISSAEFIYYSPDSPEMSEIMFSQP